MREALFGILDSRGRVRGVRVLDAFAGTGALGLEALSRGASAVTFVESAKSALVVLRKNVADLGVSARIIGLGVEATVRDLEKEGARFELILCDPPWGDVARSIPTFEALAGLLAEGGMLVLEHDKRTVIPATLARLEAVDRRTYGDTALAFFEQMTG